MLQTIEAILNPDGKLHLFENINLISPKKVLVTILPKQMELQNSQADFKTALLAMPNVGEDADFERKQDKGRNVEISNGHLHRF